MLQTWRVVVDVTIQSADDLVVSLERRLGQDLGREAVVDITQATIRIVLEIDGEDEQGACDAAQDRVTSALNETLAPHARFEVTAVRAELYAPTA